MREFWEQYVHQRPPSFIAEYVTHFSLQVPRGDHSKKMEGKAKFRFVIHGDHPAGPKLKAILMAILAEIDYQRLVGSAPKGPLERQIVALLSKRK
eukprot:1920799-Pyramimonas_sp.AAC.1